jgi:glycosyltransferase involved in cell wall biosynthesis
MKFSNPDPALWSPECLLSKDSEGTARQPDRAVKVAVVANSAWYLANFRLTLIERLRKSGCEALAISPTDRHVGRLTDRGIRHAAWFMNAASRRPWEELRAVRHLGRLLSEFDADVVFSYTPKANIYAGLALHGEGRSFVPNVSGLGYAFVKRNPLTWLVKCLYRRSFEDAYRVFFQNETDRELFVRAGLARRDLTRRLPGSGVDLLRFTPTPLPLQRRRVLLFVGRLLVDKGVADFVDAARRLLSRRDAFEVRLLGPPGGEHPSAVPQAQIEAWAREGLVTYLGETDDVRQAMAQADVVVLPSVYREGVPRSLLEAAAMGRPAITYDMPGCRDAVADGETGWVCRPGDVEHLAATIESMLEATDEQLCAMGKQARLKMEREFDEELVLRAYQEVIADVSQRKPSAS